MLKLNNNLGIDKKKIMQLELLLVNQEREVKKLNCQLTKLGNSCDALIRDSRIMLQTNFIK